MYEEKKKAMEQKSIKTALVLTFAMLGAMLSGCMGAAPDQNQFSEACGALTFRGENAIVGWEIPEDRATGPLASYHCIKM